MNVKPVKVLLVDDDEDDYLITRDIMSQIRDRRHHLDWVNNYSEGLNAVSACRTSLSSGLSFGPG